MSKRGKRVIPVGIVVETQAVENQDPYVVIVERERQKAVQRGMVVCLTERQRQVVCFVDLWGFTQTATAERLGIAQQTVSEYLAAAHRNLRNFLVGYPVETPESPLEIEGLIPPGVMEAFEEAAATAEESPDGNRYLQGPVYHGPHRRWSTPFIMAYDKQAYLDGCFHDRKTTIPRGT